MQDPLPPSTPNRGYSPEVYNSLLLLKEANQRFTDRENYFKDLKNLLAGTEFGVCLAHRHFELENGQAVVMTEVHPKKGEEVKTSGAKDEIYGAAQPEDYNSTCHHPLRWLSDGVAYEFTTQPTKTPADEMLEKFGRIVDKLKEGGLPDILGLFYRHGNISDDFLLMEKTEDVDKSVLEKWRLSEHQPTAEDIETAWYWASQNKSGEIKLQVHVLCAVGTKMEPR